MIGNRRNLAEKLLKIADIETNHDTLPLYCRKSEWPFNFRFYAVQAED